MKTTKRIITVVLCLAFLLPGGIQAMASDEPSPWAAGNVYEAIAARLVPMNLRSNYTQAITRAEFCALTVTLYELVTGMEIYGRWSFSDTDDVNVEKAAAVGIVTGVGNDLFAPDEKLTREQAAVILSRFSDAIGNSIPMQDPTFSDNDAISSWATTQVGQVQRSGIMAGVGNNRFAPKDPYTREQSIITVMRVYEANLPVFMFIGRQTFISAFINDVKIKSPVYWNHYWEGELGDFGSYVLLTPALEALGAKVSFELPNIIIAQTDALGPIEFRAEVSIDTRTEAVSEFLDGTGGCVIVDGKIYIEFFRLRMATDGSLRQTVNGDIYVYTSDFERTDIPETLEEAYKQLDEIATEEDKEFIKNVSEQELMQLNYSVGLWIRNNWLYATTGRIVKLFTDRGIEDHDEMSAHIIYGYFEYLNGRPSDIDTILE